MTRQPIARIIEITKSFGDTVAVDGVTLEFFPGEVIGLVGANGSGKTTLMRILSGTLHPDSGEVWIHERRVDLKSAADAIALGIRMLPQSLEIYPWLSVLENIFIGQEITCNTYFPRIMAWRKMEQSTARLLERVNADSLDPYRTADLLSGGQKQAVALARVLAREADLLIFDEPAASLGLKQKARVLEIIDCERDNGRAVILVSHDPDDILAVSDRIVLLRNGSIVHEFGRDKTDRRELSLQMTMA